MELRNTGNQTPLTALLISPNVEIAQPFQSVCAQTKAFQILAEMKSYPPRQTLDIRLRQLKPDVLVVDVATDFEAAAEIIRTAVTYEPSIHVIGVHTHNDSQSILAVLRLGATEYLYAPFESSTFFEAVNRIRRLKVPDAPTQTELGKVVVFASAKPGSGASTLAMQTAFFLRKRTGSRVLLVDCDLMGGTIGFCLKLNHSQSLIEILERTDRMDAAFWSEMTMSHGGVDIVPAPEVPRLQPVDLSRLHEVLEYARSFYDWVILDLPTVFQRVSLLALTESDQAFMVSTTELPSLHLTRRAVNLLSHLGIGKERFRILLNRTSKRDGIGGGDIEKIFNCPVHARFPNDYFSLHRVVTLGQPLGGDCELGKSIEALAAKLSNSILTEKRGRTALVPALSQ